MALQQVLTVDDAGGSGELDACEPGTLTARFIAHEAEVKAALPPERLLIFRPGDGWAPLCDFLGLPVPDTPFPRTNARAEFFANMDAIE